MFDIFDLFISSHPHILGILGSCLYLPILAPSYPYVCVYLLVSSHSLHPHIFTFICHCLHPCIVISSCSCVLACILASSHPHILKFINVSLHSYFLTSLGSCVLVGILASSQNRILRFTCMLTSSGQLCSRYE